MLSLLLTHIEDHQYDDQFEEIYHAYRENLFKIAMSLLHNQQDAEDATQNAFIAIARNMKTIARMDPPAVRVYVSMCARSAARDMLPGKQKRDNTLCLDEDNIPADEDMESEYISTENYKAIVAAIEELPEPYRDVLTLYYVYEMKPKEIVACLGRRRETVKSQIKRGRSILLRTLKERLDYENKER